MLTSVIIFHVSNIRAIFCLIRFPEITPLKPLQVSLFFQYGTVCEREKNVIKNSLSSMVFKPLQGGANSVDLE